ncbi:SHOCT domain-containing protein [Micromonospora inyonensis]|uniref:Short C-terminal domain-containing protein n=1 Tax=Micromonospora inyonensis TaxID=47866 RepID=A0A1C6RA75_9ACTN|nr:SHOCT domain-containing protein [Micromonospora inyonensis]SCL14036.1 Short C-terminal domain-containing protein [Micromonospora inyonensis]
MKTVARQIASLVTGLIGIVLLGIGLNQVLDIGSCSSGGSYVVARPCPEGSTGLFWLSMAGAIMWILGIIVSKQNFSGPGAGQVLWTVGFAGGGAALLVKVLTQPSMPPDARLGASIVAAVFIPMGLVVGIVGVVQLVRQRGGDGNSSRRTTGGARTGAPSRRGGPTDGSDSWSRLKVLNALRSMRVLTREEYDALKADLADSEPDGPRKPGVDRVALIRQLADQRSSGALSVEEFEARKRRVMRGERIDSSERSHRRIWSRSAR